VKSLAELPGPSAEPPARSLGVPDRCACGLLDTDQSGQCLARRRRKGDGETPQVAAAPGTVAFEPIVGLPQSLALPLAQQLSTEAGARNLTIVPRETASTAAVRAKGSFNAETVGEETVITYVWDLFDANGNRKSRFGGERRVQDDRPATHGRWWAIRSLAP
jgi:hypothetical protein